MKIFRVTLPLLLLLCFFTTSLNAGYRKDPWGSSTWTGPGRPPHWSPESTPRTTKPSHPPHRIAPSKQKNSYSGNRTYRKYRGEGGYWKDKHNRWYYHRHKRSGYIYYREPRVETVIIERPKHIPVYRVIQQKQKPAQLQCGGKTTTQRDPETGVLTIKYVSGPQDCQ